MSKNATRTKDLKLEPTKISNKVKEKASPKKLKPAASEESGIAKTDYIAGSIDSVAATPIAETIQNYEAKFNATLHQQALLYAYPIMDAYQKNKMASNSTRIHYITQCYTLNTEELNQTTESILNCLSDIVKLIGESNRIFRCQFVSSSSTLTEGFIMNTINPFFESIQANNITMEYIYDHVKSVISSSEELFKVLAFSTGIEKQPVSVVFILSSLIADETCCNWIFHETKRLLAQSLEGNSQIQMKISEKDFDYIDLQKSLISTKFQDESVHYFVEIVKNQLIEKEQHVMDPEDKQKTQARINELIPMIQQLNAQKKKLVSDLEKLQTDIDSSSKNLKSLEIFLSDTPVPDSFPFYEQSGEIKYITGSTEGKISLITSILGVEDKNDVTPLLRIHEVSENGIKRLSVDQLKWTNFANLDSSAFDVMAMSANDKKLLRALIDLVRLKINEGYQQQIKANNELRSKIQSLSRERQTLIDAISSVKSQTEGHEIEKSRLENALNPKVQKIKVPIAKFSPEVSRSNTRNNSSETLASSRLALQQSTYLSVPHSATAETPKEYPTYGFIPVKIETSLIERIENLTKRWEPLQACKKTNSLVLHAIGLAAYGIMFKHWSGMTKFALGHRFPVRNIANEAFQKIYTANSCVIGPLSPIYPFKLDLSNPEIIFADLVARILNNLNLLLDTLIFSPEPHLALGNTTLAVTRNMMDMGASFFPESSLERVSSNFSSISGSMNKMNLSSNSNLASPKKALESANAFLNPSDALDFPIQFEYINADTTNELIRQGTSIQTLFSFGDAAEDTWTRNWSFDEEEPFDLKLIFVEYNGTLLAGFRYRKDVIDTELMTKWSDRLSGILYEAEDCGKKTSIAKLISKVCYGVRASASNMNLSSRNQSTILHK